MNSPMAAERPSTVCAGLKRAWLRGPLVIDAVTQLTGCPTPSIRVSSRPWLGPPEVNVALSHFKLLIGFLVFGAPTLAQADCFRTVREVKANNVKTRWQETTENDGKPMTISIANGNDGLVYLARKADQLWLSGNISVCRTGGKTAITLKNTKTTTNVPILARMAFPRSQSAQIVGNQIKLAGGGWTGTFVGQ